MTGLPAPKPMREYSNVDRRMFEQEIRPLGQPAILRGLGTNWPAVQAAKASDEMGVEYLLSFGQGYEVMGLMGPPEIDGRFFYNADMTGMNFGRGKVALKTFFERLLHDRAVERPHSLAVQSEIVPKLLPGFVEANHIDLIDRGIEPRIWIGNQIRVAAHFDLMENIGVVVLGRRRFTVFPPEQLPNLYIGPLEVTPAGTPVSMVDIANPDLKTYPRYAEAAQHAQVAELEPGDGIYLPYHWWHAVDSLARVNAFVNYWWNSSPPGVGKPYDALLQSLFAFRGMPDEHRAVWKMVFDELVFPTGNDAVPHLPEGAKGVLGPPTAEKLERMRATLKQILSQL